VRDSSAIENEPQSGSIAHEIDWDAYASQYDLLAANNPSYRENIEALREVVRCLDLPTNAAICDVGAGTGNFICALARDLPDAHFVHLDADAGMSEIAQGKYAAAGVKNVWIEVASVTDAAFTPGRFDLMICVNALYAMHPQHQALQKMRQWLKPSGTLFIVDFGRRTKIIDWAFHILGHVLRRKGLRECLRFIRDSQESLRQNRRGSQGQADGTYWLHSTEQFGEALEEAGFQVEQLRTCYRDYCDLAVCRPRLTQPPPP
jgi:ubiquinone/menaquinone biosynthesis C-methylase UbiE